MTRKGTNDSPYNPFVTIRAFRGANFRGVGRAGLEEGLVLYTNCEPPNTVLNSKRKARRGKKAGLAKLLREPHS